MVQSQPLYQTLRCSLRHGSRRAQGEDHWAGRADIKDEVDPPGLDVWYIDIEEQTVLITAFMKTPVVQPSKRQVHFCLKKLNVLILFPNQPEDRRRRSPQ